MRRRDLLDGALGLGLGAVGSACGGSGGSSTPQLTPPPTVVDVAPPGSAAPRSPAAAVEVPPELRVGVYLPLSGPEATFGADAKLGVELALEKLGRDGLVPRPVAHFEDDRGRGLEAAACVRRLIEEHGCTAIVGSVSSSVSKAGAVMAQNLGVPMITPTASNPEVTEVGDCIFRACVTDSVLAVGAAHFAVERLRRKSIALAFTPTDALQKSLARAFEAAAVELGARIVARCEIARDAVSFATALSEMKRAKADLCFAPVYYDTMIPFAREAKAAGFVGDFFLGCDGWSDASLWKELSGGHFADQWSPDLTDPSPRAFVEAYRAKHGRTASGVAACGHDAVQIMVHAARRARSVDPALVRIGLATLQGLAGATGVMTMQSDRQPKKPIPIVRIEKGGLVYEAMAP